LTGVLDKPLRECDKDSITMALSALAEKNLGSGKSYSNGTKRQYLRTVDGFAENRDIDALTGLDVPSVTPDKVDEESVLSKSEVWDMIEVAPKQRTKAIIAILWECAFRSSALLSLKLKHYTEVNEEYSMIELPTGVVGDKGAGGAQKPVTVARPYIEQWIEQHPTGDSEDALFCRNDREAMAGEHMSGAAVRKQLYKAAEKADIDTDRVDIHSFRHARVTYMKKSREYSDMDIEHTLDWSEGSNQMQRYGHMDQSDKVNSVLQARGIEPEEGGPEPESMDCPRCSRTIPYDARNCPYCTVRVDERPAGWFSIYRQCVGQDDPIRRKYSSKASTTKPIQQLDRAEYLRVTVVLVTVLYDRRGMGQEPSEKARENVDASALDEEDVDVVEELLLNENVFEQLGERRTEWDLAVDEDTVEQVLSEEVIDGTESGAEMRREIYADVLDEDGDSSG